MRRMTIEITRDDLRRCCQCENAKPKETFYDKDGIAHPLWFCGKHRQYITELTICHSTCGGKDYKRSES